MKNSPNDFDRVKIGSLIYWNGVHKGFGIVVKFDKKNNARLYLKGYHGMSAIDRDCFGYFQGAYLICE